MAVKHGRHVTTGQSSTTPVDHTEWSDTV